MTTTITQAQSNLQLYIRMQGKAMGRSIRPKFNMVPPKLTACAGSKYVGNVYELGYIIIRMLRATYRISFSEVAWDSIGRCFRVNNTVIVSLQQNVDYAELPI